MNVLLETNGTSLEYMINGILAEVIERAEVGFRFCASLEWEGKTLFKFHFALVSCHLLNGVEDIWLG